MTHTIALYATFAALALSQVGCGCPSAYRWDGRDPPARAFYKVEQCPNEPERVVCDDVTRLPTDKCR